MGLGSGGTATEERQLMQQPWGVNGGVVATHPSSQWHAAFFPPSQLRFPTTAAGDDEGVIKLWDSRQAEAVSTLEAHSGAAAVAAFGCCQLEGVHGCSQICDWPERPACCCEAEGWS